MVVVVVVTRIVLSSLSEWELVLKWEDCVNFLSGRGSKEGGEGRGGECAEDKGGEGEGWERETEWEWTWEGREGRGAFKSIKSSLLLKGRGVVGPSKI